MGSHYQWTGRPKRAYKSEREAEVHRNELQTRDSAIVQTYLCHCGAYHVGHFPKTRAIKGWERQIVAKEEMLVGKLIGLFRGTYKPPIKEDKS